MLRLIPAPLHRAALRVGHRLRIAWWRWRRPQIEGASIIVCDDRGHVLLIRQTYGAGRWALPGGGLRRGERPEHGAARELAEELGCRATTLRRLTVTDGTLHGAPSRVHLFAARIDGEPRPDGREIEVARFYPRDALPDLLDARVSSWLALLRADASPSARRPDGPTDQSSRS